MTTVFVFIRIIGCIALIEAPMGNQHSLLVNTQALSTGPPTLSRSVEKPSARRAWGGCAGSEPGAGAHISLWHTSAMLAALCPSHGLCVFSLTSEAVRISRRMPVFNPLFFRSVPFHFHVFVNFPDLPFLLIPK